MRPMELTRERSKIFTGFDRKINLSEFAYSQLFALILFTYSYN